MNRIFIILFLCVNLFANQWKSNGDTNCGGVDKSLIVVYPVEASVTDCSTFLTDINSITFNLGPGGASGTGLTFLGGDGCFAEGGGITYRSGTWIPAGFGPPVDPCEVHHLRYVFTDVITIAGGTTNSGLANLDPGPCTAGPGQTQHYCAYYTCRSNF